MIFEECLLVLTQYQAEPVLPRPSRVKKSKPIEFKVETQEIVDCPPMHSIDELAIIGCIDSMPVMDATKRVRAPITMSARPRLGRVRVQIQPVAPEPRKIRAKTRVIADGDITVPPKRSGRRKPIPEIIIPPARIIVTANTPTTLIANLVSTDVKMLEKALEIVGREVISEPVLPIHTAIRVVLQASVDLGRPYDTNMLAFTFGVTRSLVMQSLRKYYEGFIEQSLFTEAMFVPTYLWLYGLEGDVAAVESIVQAINLSGAAEPGSRSVFAIARDFVILYITEVFHGFKSQIELTGLSSVTAVMNSIKSPPEVPSSFIEMTNSFLYRARMTGRSVLRAKPQLAGTIGSLFE